MSSSTALSAHDALRDSDLSTPRERFSRCTPRNDFEHPVRSGQPFAIPEQVSDMDPRRGRQQVRTVEVIAVLGGSAVLAGSWVLVAANQGVPEWERQLFVRVNDGPDVLWRVVWTPMQLGSLVGSLVVVAVIFLVTRQ